jgi:hypothetical protein
LRVLWPLFSINKAFPWKCRALFLLGKHWKLGILSLPTKFVVEVLFTSFASHVIYTIFLGHKEQHCMLLWFAGMTMTVFCKKSDDTLEKVDIGKSKAEETIGSLKTAVEAKIGIPVENQQLYLYGQTLEDVRTLQHYEIQCWTTLELKETEIR